MTNFLKSHSKAVVAACLGLAVIGGGAAAAAATSTAARPTLELTAPATPGSSTTSGHAGRAGRLGRLAGLAKRTVHGDLLVKTKNGYQTFTFDRGKVSSANSTSITIQRPDGVSVTESLTATTKYRGIGGSGAITTGRGAVVISRNGTAVAVLQRPLSAGTSGSSASTTGTATSA